MTTSLNLQKFLRKLFFPIIYARRIVIRLVNSQKRTIENKIFNGLKNAVVADPIVYIKEFNGRFKLDVRSDLFRRIITSGYYEPKLVAKVASLIDKNKDFVDVGANVGFFSVFAAKSIKGNVLSVEPTPAALGRLKENIKINNVADKVVIYEGVASDFEGESVINTIVGKEEYSSVGVMEHPSISEEKYKKIKIESNTLDNLVLKHDINPGFIKIDVEGAEYLVLGGAKNILSEQRPIILAELSDFLLKKNGSSSLDVINYIKSYNYEVIDPLNKNLIPGSKEFGDILCLPKTTA